MISMVCSSSPIGLLLLPHQVPTHGPKSREVFLDLISPKSKSVLSGVRGSLSVQSSILDTGQEVSFYTCERKSFIHGMLMAVDSSDDRLIPSMQVSTYLH